MPDAKPPEKNTADAENTTAPARSAVSGTKMYYFAACSAVLAAGIAAAALLIQFLEARPLNLRHHSARLATVAEQILVENFVPAESIRRHPSELRRDEGAVWDFYRFDAEAPRQAGMDGVAQILRETMLQHYVNTVDAPEAGGGRRISLLLGEREFARFLLQPPHAPHAAVLRDLRASCERLAREVEALFSGALRREAAMDREDADARWTLTRFRMWPMAEYLPGDVRGRVEEAIGTMDIATSTREEPEGAALVTITYSGKRCIEIFFPPGFAAAMPPLDGDAAPPDGQDVPLDSSEAGETFPDEPHAADAAERLTPRVAIILDDGGYGGEVTDRVLDMDARLTIAILPNTPFAQSTAARAAEKGFEIMLHMPMATHGNGGKPFPGEISPDMDRKEIQRLTRDAIGQIAGARGVNNHTGSRFTEDAERLRDFFDVVHESGLYFVDSRTHAATKAYDIAREEKVPAARRDVFLDNEADTAYIRKQWDELLKKAKEQGSAIGIGHFRDTTISVLAEALPKLADAGIALVPASELLQ